MQTVSGAHAMTQYAGGPSAAVLADIYQPAVNLAVWEGGLDWQARLGADDKHNQRIASRAGLRREGVVRGGAGHGADEIQVARVATDPPLTDHATFTAVLNAGLPTKRCIAQAIVRDGEGATKLLTVEVTGARDRAQAKRVAKAILAKRASSAACEAV